MKLARLLAALSIAASASAQVAGVPDGSDLGSRPDPEGSPTRVEVGMFLLDLWQVDDARQTFTADLHLSVRWDDPRLSRDPSGELMVGREYPLSDVWHPSPLILNLRSANQGLPDIVRIMPGEQCQYGQRWTGEFAYRANLHDFPFDHQSLDFTVVFPPYAGPMELALDEDRTGIWEEVSTANWELASLSNRTGKKTVPHVADFELFEFTIDVRRNTAYYAWHVILPLVIVVLMSWSVFWIGPTIPLQLGLSATSVLTLVAYRFAVATLLPPISYLTRLDQFLVVCSLLVLGALVEALVTVGLAHGGRVDAALRIDRLARIVFPILLAVGFWVSFL